MRNQKRTMVGAGLDVKTGEMRTKPMTCQLCRGDQVYVDIDNSQFKVNVCDDCGAWHVISKAKTTWWYHDAQLPADMAPTFAKMVAEST